MANPIQIQAILAQRQPLADRLETVELHLTTLEGRLRDLEHHRKALVAKVEDPQVRERLQSLNLTNLERDIVARKASLVKLKGRFSRNTLNIGVVGRARQGKSRLLQSLSGLSTAEIPTGDSDHCTGVKSIIYHRSQGETYGEVVFYSEVELLHEVIYPYYDRLSLGSKPVTLKEFVQKPLPPLLDRATTTDQAMYEHLQRYHAHGETCRSLSSHYGPMRIKQEQIREYVAQDTIDRQRVYFNYLAVREARIFCEFPNAEVGQVALIDMPGLGDTGLGDEERLIQTLGQDVDVVLFVRKPRAGGDGWGDVDVQLYDTARSALPELPLEKWSFYVLNRTFGEEMGNNSRNCDDLRADMPTKHLEVVEAIVANCADPSEANEKVLDRVLDYLATEITHLDREYAQAFQEQLQQLHLLLELELDKAKVALGELIRDDTSFPVFLQLYNGLWDDLTNGLEDLLQELQLERDLQDEDFEKQVRLAIQACKSETGIPTVTEIRRIANSLGSYSAAYARLLNEVRARLSGHFLSLDDSLRRSLEQTKTRVVEVLRKEGRLQYLSPAEDSQFLRDIEAQIPDYAPGLKLGFEILSSFMLAYRGLVQHRIRKHLDCLTPNLTDVQLPPRPTAEQVLESLEVLHGGAIYECENALEELFCEPSQAAYAIVEEFVDRVLRAKNVRDEWLTFLQSVKEEIWPNEFEQLSERSKMCKEWLSVLKLAQEANQSQFFNFTK